MAKSSLTTLALVGSLALGGATFAHAQDSGALLNLLAQKGIISDQEAEDLRAELTKEFAVNAPAGKLDLSSRLTRFAIAGDVRVRYQYDNEISNTGTLAPQTDVSRDRSRYRYRFRLATTASFLENWTAGIRLETANGATSTNADFASNTGPSTNFSKTNDTPFIGQAYIQYSTTNFYGVDRVDFRVGRFGHTFFTPGVNGFWIDTDINFEGLSQEFAFTDVAGPWDLALRTGQFILSSNSGLDGASGRNEPDMMYIAQTEFSDTRLVDNNPYGWRIAPALVVFSDASKVSGGPINSDASNYNDLFTVLIPIEYTLQALGQPLALYATYGYNFEGGSRANRLYSTSGTVLVESLSGNPSSYNQMFNLGARFGSSRNKGDTQYTAEYRYVEPGAYTSLLLDSDFNGGRLNGSGFIVSASRLITDAITGTVTFFHAENIDENGRPQSSTTGQGFHKADVLQVDLSARF
jgi:Putative porin